MIWLALALIAVATVAALAVVVVRRDAHRHEIALLEARRPASPTSALDEAVAELRTQIDGIDTRVNRLELRASFGGKR